MKQRSFSIFFNASSGWLTPSDVGRDDLRYFGQAQFAENKTNTDYHLRGLELPELPQNYTDAFRNVCVAAAHILGIRFAGTNSLLVDGESAIQQLRYLGYFVLRLDKFVESY